jgi:hypothetical protein
MQCSSASHHFLPLRSKDFPHHPVLILPQSVSSYSVRDQVSHPCKTWPFEKFVDWRQCAAIMQREEVTVMPSCSGGVT